MTALINSEFDYSPQTEGTENPRATMDAAISEWRASCVDEEIIQANVSVIHGEDVIDRLNLTDKLGDKTGTFITKGGAKILACYDSVIDGGGWYVNGLDPETNFASRMDWGKLKPAWPRPRVNRPGPQKYEQPCGMPARAVFLENLSKPGYWKSIQAVPTDLYICEGEKKAGALLSLGFAAVSVSGIWNATKKNEWGKHQIIPDLKHFCQKGRHIYFVYDSEGVPRKDFNIYKAIKAAGRAFQREGCEVAWVSWDSSLGKGIDDVCANHGPDKVREILAKPSRLKSYEEQLYCVNKSPDQHIFEQFFQKGKGDWAVINQGFYRYAGSGYWQHVKDAEMEKTLGHFMMKCYRPGGKDKPPVYNVATDRALKSAFSFCRKALSVGDRGNANNHLRCFKNCTLNMQTRQIQPHCKEDYLTSRIDADYIPGRECPATFNNFVASSFGAENMPLVRAVLSMYLDPTAPWGYFLYIFGASGGGKGTLIRFIEDLYDSQNVNSGISFGDIAKPEGRHQYLKNTALYCLPDMGGYIQGVRAFYELVDNGQLSGRALYSSTTYHDRFNTRFIVASVEPLSIENSGDGWERRAIVLPVQSGTREKDITLEDRLKLCKSDVISWALAMPKDERNYILLNSASVSETAAEAKRKVTMTGDSVRQFIDLCLRPAPAGTHGTSLSDIHTWYREFAKAFGYSDLGQSKLGSRIQSVVPSAYNCRRKMKAGDPGYQRNTFIPASYQIVAIPGLFEDVLTNSNGYVSTIHKNRAQEGGIDAFSQGIDYEIKEALISCTAMDRYNEIVHEYTKEAVDRVWHSLLPGSHQDRISALTGHFHVEATTLEPQASEPDPLPNELSDKDIKETVEMATQAVNEGIPELLETFRAFSETAQKQILHACPLEIQAGVIDLRKKLDLKQYEST